MAQLVSSSLSPTYTLTASTQLLCSILHLPCVVGPAISDTHRDALCAHLARRPVVDEWRVRLRVRHILRAASG